MEARQEVVNLLLEHLLISPQGHHTSISSQLAALYFLTGTQKHAKSQANQLKTEPNSADKLLS